MILITPPCHVPGDSLLTLKDLRGTAVSSLTLSPDSELLPRVSTDITGTTDAVAPILQEVRTRGTAAMMDFAERFDGVRPSALRVPAEVLAEAAAALDPQIREALETAIARTREVHSAQLPAASVITPGPDARVTNRWVPMARVGLYVPGGQAVYPSSVVMNVVPAQVAGVESLVIASPPQKDSGGGRTPRSSRRRTCWASMRCTRPEAPRRSRCWPTGRAARRASSTAPGQLHHRAGQHLRRDGQTGRPGRGGHRFRVSPTEIMVLADETAPAHLIAADLISQAEHDELAAAVLVTPSESLAQRVIEHVETRAAVTKHAERVRSSLTGSQSAVLVVDDLDAAIAVANAYGAEHLEIMTGDDARVAERITEVSAIFVGPYTPVSLGDYCAGSNHILPTGGAARYSSGLNVTAFMRSQQVVHYGREGLGMVSAHVRRLADEEGCGARRRSGRPLRLSLGRLRVRGAGVKVEDAVLHRDQVSPDRLERRRSLRHARLQAEAGGVHGALQHTLLDEAVRERDSLVGAFVVEAVVASLGRVHHRNVFAVAGVLARSEHHLVSGQLVGRS